MTEKLEALKKACVNFQGANDEFRQLDFEI